MRKINRVCDFVWVGGILFFLTNCSLEVPKTVVLEKPPTEISILNEKEGILSKEKESGDAGELQKETSSPLDSQETTPEQKPETPPEKIFEKSFEQKPELQPEQTTKCPQGVVCVATFPFSYKGNSKTGGTSQWNVYPCKANSMQGGNEFIFQIEVMEEGFLSAAVYSTSSVDMDIHILTALDPNQCVVRGDKDVRLDVKKGVYYVVVDTFSKGNQAYSGEFQLDIGLITPSKGSCKMQTGIMKRVKDNGNHLQMPATGKMVLEAHLVSDQEKPPYPSTSTEFLKKHYQLSQSVSKLVMFRKEKWAPLEGGTFYGAGIGSPTLFPTLDEAWYVNMYWEKVNRPARGTRMIVRIPGTKRAVVVAAGYETGPGDLSRIGGTTEETHFYMGTSHLGEITLGIASEPTLPLGPRICTD